MLHFFSIFFDRSQCSLFLISREFLFTILVLPFIFTTNSCNRSDSTVKINGQIKHGNTTAAYIKKRAVHYKYARSRRLPLSFNPENEFKTSIRIDSSQIAFLHMDDRQYPIYLQPGERLTVQANRGSFPLAVEIEGYRKSWDDSLDRYLRRQSQILRRAGRFEEGFEQGINDTLLTFYKRRIRLARRLLFDTPLQMYYYRAVGEYLVKQLEFIKYRLKREPELNLTSERRHVIDRAKAYDFFSFKSLWAQRAGIFDFANAYAMSLGIESRLEHKYGQDLVIYDVKRLGYETIDSAKVSLLKHLPSRDSKAYVQMYYVAERIGEMPLETAEPSYRRYLEEYDDYPAYTSFLKEFYARRKKVSPGQPAVSFTLPDSDGQMRSMKEFRGKYVLLDFWASWCIPCLNEFSHMKELYQTFDRGNFEIVGISIEKDSLRWRRAINRYDLPWVQVYGGHGFRQETFSSYQGGGIPFYILIGPEGRIRRYNDIRPSFNLPRILDSLIHNTEQS